MSIKTKNLPFLILCVTANAVLLYTLAFKEAARNYSGESLTNVLAELSVNLEG